jgi:hypothetical protein
MAIKKTWKRDGRRRKGVWPFSSTWFSFCSAHQRYKANCDLCNAGTWINDIRHAVSSFVFKRWPDFWRWYVNRNNPYKFPPEGMKRG